MHKKAWLLIAFGTGAAGCCLGLQIAILGAVNLQRSLLKCNRTLHTESYCAVGQFDHHTVLAPCLCQRNR